MPLFLSLIFISLFLLGGQPLNAGPKIQVVKHLDQKIIEEGLELKGSLTVTNTGTGILKILGVKPSCGCTTIKIPKRKLKAAESTVIPFVVDTRGKVGKVEKTIKIYSNAPGPVHVESITFHSIPQMKGGAANLDFILEPPCASCHIDPSVEKNGAALFNSICKMCHMVGLKTKSKGNLIKIISDGIPEMGMPPFKDYLDESQIQSLTETLLKTKGL